MGTRADFYIELNDQSMEWIGSKAYDGHVGNFVDELKITNKDEFRQKVTKMLHSYDDATFPEQGWPWPWEYTGVSDMTYVFRERFSKVFIFRATGGKNNQWGVFVDPLDENYFIEMPSMKCVGNYTEGRRSGVMFVGVTENGKLGINDKPDSKAPKPFPPAIFKKCPYCDHWIPPINGTCKCAEYHGKRLSSKDTRYWEKRPLGIDARKEGYAWTFSKDFYYTAKFKNNKLAVFEREFKNGEYELLVRKYGEPKL